MLDHVWRNRQELYDILQNLAERHEEDREQERVVCCQCHAGAASLRVAVHNGWTSFQRDDEGEEWAYLGVCGSCQRKQVEEERQEALGAATMESSAEKRKEVRQTKSRDKTVPKIGDDASIEAVPETIACIYCDVDSPPSLAVAREEGWARLDRDDGAGWNFLGVCPDCLRRETEDDRRFADEGREMGLNREQLQQAKAERVTTALGLRRIEKNSHSGDGPERVGDRQATLFGLAEEI